MADRRFRIEENVDGPWYVDEMCIDCDLCRNLAPENFRQYDRGGFSYVFRQPTTPEEETACRQAAEDCPVKAIGDDGGGPGVREEATGGGV